MGADSDFNHLDNLIQTTEQEPTSVHSSRCIRGSKRRLHWHSEGGKALLVVGLAVAAIDACRTRSFSSSTSPLLLQQIAVAMVAGGVRSPRGAFAGDAPAEVCIPVRQLPRAAARAPTDRREHGPARRRINSRRAGPRPAPQPRPTGPYPVSIPAGARSTRFEHGPQPEQQSESLGVFGRDSGSGIKLRLPGRGSTEPEAPNRTQPVGVEAEAASIRLPGRSPP